MIIKLKENKAQCPICEKFIEIKCDENLGNGISCCNKSWSLFQIGMSKEKPKKKIKKKKIKKRK